MTAGLIMILDCVCPCLRPFTRIALMSVLDLHLVWSLSSSFYGGAASFWVPIGLYGRTSVSSACTGLIQEPGVYVPLFLVSMWTTSGGKRSSVIRWNVLLTYVSCDCGHSNFSELATFQICHHYCLRGCHDRDSYNQVPPRATRGILRPIGTACTGLVQASLVKSSLVTMILIQAPNPQHVSVYMCQYTSAISQSISCDDL
jgi:hypothetical protein